MKFMQDEKNKVNQIDEEKGKKEMRYWNID